MKPLIIAAGFTFLIHLSESTAYCMRLAGVRSRQIAIALSFVTSTLLISRLSNMFQAPILGAMVDGAILEGTASALVALETQFRLILLAGGIGTVVGALLTPTAVQLFQTAIVVFLKNGSLPRTVLSGLKPTNLIKLPTKLRLPNLLKWDWLSLKGIPAGFLVMNIFVTSIYAIGVLCALLAGAYLPEMRATAIQLSGIVNGLATILLTLFVDPGGARITDKASNGELPETAVKTVIFYMLAGRLVGTLLLAQFFLKPFTLYILWFTQLVSRFVL